MQGAPCASQPEYHPLASPDRRGCVCELNILVGRDSLTVPPGGEPRSPASLPCLLSHTLDKTDRLIMQRVAVAALGRAVCLGARWMGSATQARTLQLHNSWQAPVAARQFHFSRPVAAAAGEVREWKTASKVIGSRVHCCNDWFTAVAG